MKLAYDEAGHVIVEDGRPVYEHSDGKRVPFDAPKTVETISRLNNEAKGHRERAEAAERTLKAFEGIEDPDAARKALETAANLKAGDLVTAGKVEEIKAAAKKAAEEQVAANAKAYADKLKQAEEDRDRLRNDLYAEKVGGAFSRSKFVTEKVAVPHDMLQATFGQRFKVEDGRTVGYDATGNKIYSRAKPGELAEFDEAIEMMVDSYPYRDSILKGTGATGSGARPGNGAANAGSKTMTRSEFDRLPPQQRPAALKSGVTVVD